PLMVTATLRLIRTSSELANPPAANRYSTRIDECLAQCQFTGYDEGRSGTVPGDLQHRDFAGLSWAEGGYTYKVGHRVRLAISSRRTGCTRDPRDQPIRGHQADASERWVDRRVLPARLR